MDRIDAATMAEICQHAQVQANLAPPLTSQQVALLVSLHDRYGAGGEELWGSECKKPGADNGVAPSVSSGEPMITAPAGGDRP